MRIAWQRRQQSVAIHEWSFGQSLAADSDLAPERRVFLESELVAMRTTIQILAGNAPNFADEVKSLYGVTPEWIDEYRFEMAHNALDERLPGSEPLAKRVQDFRKRSRVSVEVAVSIVRQLSEEFRGRTRRLFGIPEEENCEITTINDQPWCAYNWYLEECKSRIEMNALMVVASESELVDLWIDCYDRAKLCRSDAVRAKDFFEATAGWKV